MEEPEEFKRKAESIHHCHITYNCRMLYGLSFIIITENTRQDFYIDLFSHNADVESVEHSAFVGLSNESLMQSLLKSLICQSLPNLQSKASVLKSSTFVIL